MSSQQQPDPAAEVRALGRAWLTEAERLRHLQVPDEDGELRPFEVPDAAAQPPEIREALTVVRGCLDRLEEIYGQVMALASAARISAREKTATADDAFDRAISDRAKQAPDYQAARERLAEASLDTFELRRAARTAQKAADLATGTEKQIQLRYYGLRGLRDSLAERLRGFSWESNLDR